MKITQLLISLGIIGIVTMSSLGVYRQVPLFRLKSASFRIYNMFVEARNIALRTGSYCAVVIEESELGHYLTIVKDENYNGVRFKEFLSGRDKEVAKGFILEKEYPGVRIEKIGFSSKHVISFSPFFKSSNGSLYLSTENEEDGVIRLKIYGKSFIVKPIKIFPDGEEVEL